jgi:hypothetical protein
MAPKVTFLLIARSLSRPVCMGCMAQSVKEFACNLEIHATMHPNKVKWVAVDIFPLHQQLCTDVCIMQGAVLDNTYNPLLKLKGFCREVKWWNEWELL